MQWWKVLGVAAFVGVAATGVLVARTERRYHEYSPEEIRERLHARAAEALAEVTGDEADAAAPPVGSEGAEPGAGGVGETEEVAEVEAAGAEAPGVEAPGVDAPGVEAPGASPSLAGLRRRAATAVNHIRTRLGVRPLPTRRRRPR